jgi:hypothetical protein
MLLQWKWGFVIWFVDFEVEFGHLGNFWDSFLILEEFCYFGGNFVILEAILLSRVEFRHLGRNFVSLEAILSSREEIRHLGSNLVISGGASSSRLKFCHLGSNFVISEIIFPPQKSINSQKPFNLLQHIIFHPQ